jgi:hypothetical protein
MTAKFSVQSTDIGSASPWEAVRLTDLNFCRRLSQHLESMTMLRMSKGQSSVHTHNEEHGRDDWWTPAWMAPVTG